MFKWCAAATLVCGGYWLGYLHSHTVLSGLEEKTTVTVRRRTADAPSSALFNASRLPASRVPEAFEEPDCSGLPQPGYPKKVAIADIVNNWNPDNTTMPAKMYRSLCRFDYQTQFDLALAYRDLEVPFQLYNVPDLNDISRKWHSDDYLRSKLGRYTKYKCEASNPGGEMNHGANHFMYTNGRSTKKKPPPIKHVRLTWDEWLRKVREGSGKPVDAPDTRFYFRVSATSPSDAQAGWLFKELKFFQPQKSNIFLKEPRGQRGIHCRFGMEGVIAEAHWDGSRNMIAQFYGNRRYILVDPEDSCDMYLLAKNHPSGRHSEVDWSKPETWGDYPKFPTMKAHEVVNTAGTMLYLPTYYLHYIVSLDRNYQCNSRSGRDDRQTRVVNRCTPGFEPSPSSSSKKQKKKKVTPTGKH